MRTGKPLRYGLTLILFLLIAYFSAPLDQAYAAEANAIAKLADMQGQVYVTRGSSFKELRATNDLPIFQGDWLRTEKNGYVKLIFNDGTETSVDADALLTVERLSQTEQLAAQGHKVILAGRKAQQVSLKLWSGSIWSKVKSLLNVDDEYEVETPTAVMGVRGTLFKVAVDKESGTTTGTVMDGTVAARQNKELTQTGQEKMVTTGQELAVNTLKEELPIQQEINKEKLVETTPPKMLVEMIKDVSTRVEELLQTVKQAQTDYQQSKDSDSLKKALILVQKSTELATITHQIVVQVETSTKAQAVQEILKQENTSIEVIKNKAEETKQDTQKTQTAVIDTAKKEGLSTEQIENISKDKSVTSPAPLIPDTPTPAPTPTPIPTPSGDNNYESNTAPQATNVHIVGTPEAGSALQGAFTYYDAQNDAAGTHIYRWLVSNSQSGSFTAILGATSTTLILSNDLVGKYLKFEVTPQALTGISTGQAAMSSTIGPVTTVEGITSINGLSGSGTEYTASIPEGSNSLVLPTLADVIVGGNSSTREIVWDNEAHTPDSFVFRGIVNGFNQPIFLTIQNPGRPVVVLLPVADKTWGDSVTIAGATTLDEIAISVYRPDGSHVFLKVVRATNNSFNVIFTMPLDSPIGEYTIGTGQVNIVANTKFNLQ